jgi:hypothetical protein
MPSHNSAKLKKTEFLFYFVKELRVKRVLNLAFAAFHYKLYDILYQIC